jgi:hypothetical protein
LGLREKPKQIIKTNSKSRKCLNMKLKKRRRRKTKGNGKERGEMVKKKKKGTRFTIHINNKGTRFTIHMRKEELKMKILHCLYIYIKETP